MNKTNLLIDLGIFGAFLVAMEPRLTGVAIHEWLSVAFAATVVVHILLHWKWVMTVGKTFFRKLWRISRLKFVVDVLLFVAVTGVMTSGLLISHSVVPALGIALEENRAFRVLHSLSADAALILMGVHFALNWKWVVAMLKRYTIDPLFNMLRAKKLPEMTGEATVQPVAIKINRD